MSSLITVRAPGLQTTVQDLGRPGHGEIGVSPSGAADRTALRLGNLLVGNAESSAALEMTLLGGTFEFGARSTIALTGSDFGAALDGEPVDLWEAKEVRPGQVLACEASRGGARCYLCVAGGLNVPPVLGSASTHLASGLGGWHGRALREGDSIPIGEFPGSFRERRLSAETISIFAPRTRLRVTAGPHFERFAESSRKLFFENSWTVSRQSNRLGLRLEGPPLAPAGEIVSAGVGLGTVQVTSDGQPIVLFVDQQTTGGYPQLACVASVDHSSLGQLSPSDEIAFELVEAGEAVRLLRAAESRFDSGDLFA
ncbi:MAG: biotin-dependent carboxyltransferase family protein [Elusimicrobiota bacterium]